MRLSALALPCVRVSLAALILMTMATLAPAQANKIQYGDIIVDVNTIISFDGVALDATFNWGPLTAAPTGNINVDLDGTGDIFIVRDDGSFTAITLPQPYDPPAGNWSYESANMRLDASGAHGNLAIELPAQIQWKEDASDSMWREDALPVGNEFIDQNLVLKFMPSISVIDIDAIRMENEPFWFEDPVLITFQDVTGLVFHFAAGQQVVYQHEAEFSSGPGPRPSNDAFFAIARPVDNRCSVYPDGMRCTLESDLALLMQSGWPMGLQFGAANFNIEYEGNQIKQGTFGSLTTVLSYDGAPCGGGPLGSENLGASSLAVGPDGALLGSPATPNAGTFEYAFDAYQVGPVPPSVDGTIYLPGWCTSLFPSNYVISGRKDITTSANSLVSPGEEDYTDGMGFYGGYNLSRTEMAGVDFALEIACANAPFVSSNASKLYIRRGGVSGTLDASATSVGNLPPLNLYGEYVTQLTRFNNCFLDNLQHLESAIDGNIDLPFPSDTVLAFTALELDACGAPGGATLEEASDNVLAYWNRTFDFQAISFEDTDPPSFACGQTPRRKLWAESTNPIPNLSRNILMRTQFDGDGDIGESIALGEPDNTLQEYKFTLRKVYYSAWDGTQNLNGKTIVIGDMKLPFWGLTPVVALWDIGLIPNVFNGRDYAADPPGDIDPDRNGFPGGITSIQQYIDSAAHRPVVKSSFANIIPLEYPVKYNSVLKRFETAAGDEKDRDLVVIEVSSSVRGITKDDTEILFGVSYQGLPAINLSSLLEDLADPAIQQLLSPLKSAMNNATSALASNFGEAIRAQMADVTRPVVTQMVNDLRAVGDQAAGVSADLTMMNNAIDLRLASFDSYIESQLRITNGPIIKRIDQLLKGLEDVIAVIEQLNPEQLEAVLVALIEITGNDASGVQQVFGDVQAARNYIVNELIGQQLKPQLIQIRQTLTGQGVIPSIDALFDDSAFDQMIANVKTELKKYADEINESAAVVRNLDPEEVNTFVVNTIYNELFFTLVISEVQELFEPLKTQIQGVLNGFFDALNNQVKAYLDLIGAAINNVTTQINDVVGVKAAEIAGYAVFSHESLDRLHMDAAFEFTFNDGFGFRASLDMERFKNNTNGEVCGTPAGAESIRVAIAVYGIPLKFPRSSLVAEIIEFNLRLNQTAPENPFYVSDIGGRIETSGALSFEAVKLVSPAFAAGVGENETYIAFSGSVIFNAVAMRGGIFLGKTCNGVEILKTIDPEVGEIIAEPEIAGIYAFGEAAIPIIDYGCFLRIGATAGAGFWYWVNTNSFGGKMTAGVFGEGVCLISVRGKIVLVGGKKPSGFFFSGTGWIAGGLGWCEPEGWFTVGDVWADKWCVTCVLWLQATYLNGWSVDPKAECRL